MIASRFLACTSLLGVVICASPAVADDEPAQVLFDRGVEEMTHKRYETACPAIAQSYQIDPRPGVLFALADCEAQRGRLATAVARYEEYLTLYATLPADKKAKQGERPQQARAQKVALGPDVPLLTLVVSAGAPAGLVVKRDGVVLSDAALKSPLAVDPGDHTVTTQVPGGAPRTLTLTIEKRERKTVILEVVEVPRAPPPATPATVTLAPPTPVVVSTPKASPPAGPRRTVPPPPATTAPSGRRVGAFVAGGVGVAGVVVGAVTGGLMLAKGRTVADECADNINDPGGSACRNQSGVDAGNAAKTFGIVSSVGWGVGLAGLGVATVLFLIGPSKPKGPPAHGALRSSPPGDWLSHGTFSVGPSGSTLGIQGAW